MEKSGQELTPEDIKWHNENAKLRNEVSKKYEKKRRKKTAKILGFKSTKSEVAEVENKLSQLELSKVEINSDFSSTSTSESVISNNINKLTIIKFH